MDFEAHREHLHDVAFRMLGSHSESDDAVQECWLRMNRGLPSDVANPRGWLTTVIARICLDMLRARSARREDPLDVADLPVSSVGPEDHAVLADSVGIALMVVLQTLTPAERLALVLHDIFDVPFSEIAPIVGRSENATAQLASRARRRVRGQTPDPATDLSDQRRLVEAFLCAARDGDFHSLLAALDADVVLRVDAAAAGTATTIRGAQAVAANAHAFSANARFAEPALVNGAVGIVVAPAGRLALVLLFATVGDRITEIDIESDPDRLGGLSLALLD